MIHTVVTPTPYPVGDVNVYVLKGDALSIVDAGDKIPEALEALKFGIREIGYELRDIEQVIITHHHPDHVGWIDAFPNAAVVGHSYNDFWLKAEPQFLDYAFEFYIEQLAMQGVPGTFVEEAAKQRQFIEDVASRPLTHVLEDGDAVPGHPNLKAIYTPGHALSHYIFFDEKERRAIGGDLLLPHVTPNPLIEPPAIQGEPRSKSLLDYNASLKLLERLELEKLYPGHGGIIQNPNNLIEERNMRQQKQAKRLLSFASNVPQSVFELNAKFYASIFKVELVLTLSKTQGYIDLLVDYGMLQEELGEEGIFKYSLK